MNNHSNEGRKIEAVTTQNSWHEKINEPTHILNNFSLCIDLIFNRIWCSPILHRSCHRQMIHAKFNLDIVYPPPYERERDFVLSNGEYWSCQTWIKWIWLGKVFSSFDVDKMVYIFNKTVINILCDFIPPEGLIWWQRSSLLE